MRQDTEEQVGQEEERPRRRSDRLDLGLAVATVGLVVLLPASSAIKQVGWLALVATLLWLVGGALLLGGAWLACWGLWELVTTQP